ncbi:MAG: hypothetical protein K8T90_08275 [Planctomycetes bacterium]|nr:hypothetical protein [Planctomycetota bacterium]
MVNRKTGVLAVAALACIAMAQASARADEARERALETRIGELEKRLDSVSENVRGGYFTANSDLEARISDLERTSLDNKGGMNVIFKNGLKSESDDKAFSYQWYGRIQNDWTWFDADEDAETAVGEMNGGVQFRRVRIGATGTMYGNVKFKSEFDFSGGAASFADVYMELTNCSFGTIRVGHFDEPTTSEQLMSSRFGTFIERNITAQAFAPQRNTGIMLYGNAAEDMLTYQVGMFRDANAQGADTGNTKSGEYNLVGRLCGRPIVQDDGNTWLHLGMSYNLRDFSSDEVKYSAKPLINIAPNWADTGTLKDISDGSLFGLESMFVSGPLTLKGETVFAHGNGASDTTAEDYDFSALSLEASYWLTGESTQYDLKAGRTDRPKVKKNYGDGDGIGAWQIAVGYDTLDLVDGGYDGGELDIWRFGVNWFLNPNTRISLNVVDAQGDWAAKGLDDSTRALVMRFQVDF